MKKFISADIISVGTEILMGQIVNTNAAYLAGQLASLGIPSYRQSVVGDNPKRIKDLLTEADNRSDLIIVTGGLGATQDDITQQVVADFLGLKLVSDPLREDKIRKYFENTGRVMPLSNLKQALLPETGIEIPNRKGTAPGCILEYSGKNDRNKAIVILPGPPFEMKPMFEETVLPYLSGRNSIMIYSEYVRIFGISESAAEERIADIINDTTNPTIAPYCGYGECAFRLSYTVDSPSKENELKAKKELQITINKIKERLGDYIYEIGSRGLPEVVIDDLKKHGLTLSLAESCTGGMISTAITDIPGASHVFKGSAVVYSNESKTNLLGVPEETIREFGAVSYQTALAMAVGCRNLFGTDLALSVTGVAGPGESEKKKAGLVYLALAWDGGEEYIQLNLNSGRDWVRKLSTFHGLNMVRKKLTHY